MVTSEAVSEPSSWAEEEEEASLHTEQEEPVQVFEGWAEAETCTGRAVFCVAAVWGDVGVARCVRPAAGDADADEDADAAADAGADADADADAAAGGDDVADWEDSDAAAAAAAAGWD